MTDGKSSMSRRTKAVFAVVAVAIMIGAVFPLLFSETSADPQLQAYQQSITYNSNNGQSYTRTIVYDGIASTEYNPEFWEGTGHVPASIDLCMRQVNPATGELVKNQSDFQVYDVVPAGTDVGNLAVYYDQNGTKYDPFVHGRNASEGGNNWKGETISITDIQMTGVTIKKNIGTVTLSSDLTITDVSPSTGVTFSGNTITYNESSDLTNVTITVTLTTNKVFGGWNTAADGTGNKYLPGDIILPDDVTFYTQWITPDVFTKDNATINKNSNTIYCKPYAPTTSGGNPNFNVSGYTAHYGDDRDSKSMYGTIYALSGSYTLANGIHLPMGTYRSLDAASKATLNVANKSNALLDGDVIIDDVHIDSSAGVKHSTDQGVIFAEGNVLIMGVGIDNPSLTTSKDLSNGDSGAPGLYGGKKGGQDIPNLTEYMTSENMQFFDGKKRFVFAERDSNGKNITCDHYVSTCVIVHSGIYKVIAGGGFNNNVGANGGTDRSTYMVLRGGASGDAIYGGGTGTGAVFGDTKNHTGNPEDMKFGGTFAYLLGHFFMSGDNWQDKMTGNLYKIAGRDSFKVLENTVASASCHKANTMSTSHMFISDHASVWVANGANREESGYTRIAMLDISGSSVVRNIAAGGIANAKLKEDTGKESLKEDWVCVRDNATVALVLGGGYDIWQNPEKVAMKQGYVNVIVSGGTVGNVYGGGYRGSIGTPGDPAQLTVNVTISGGTVLGNVYGGGSGGTDRGQHNPDGTWARSSTTTMSEGRSYVYGNVNVNITGGTVNGNVYGGGMSVPSMKTYVIDGSYQPANSDEKQAGAAIGGLYVKVDDDYRSASKEDIYSGTQLYYINNGDYTKKTIAEGDKVNVLYVDNGSGYFAATDAQLATGGDDLMIFKGTSKVPNNFGWNSTNYVAEVEGSTNVTISGGDILGSVYGGGEGITMTKVGENDSLITKDYSRVTVVKSFGGQNTIDTLPWFINGEPVYRTIGTYTAYLSYANVNTSTSVNITGNAHISGGVFGGGCSGYVNGNRTVNVACTSIAEGEDYNVDNSVYGGSSEGNDNGNATVVISAGKLKGSVFGGGFMGVTTGDTKVYLGYVLANNGLPTPQNSINKITSEPSITIADSVFAGANVKDDPTIEPYTVTLVTGTGYVYIDGAVTSVNISGSIMGDGNSCLTGASPGHNAYIEINNYDCGESELTGIHRAKEVTLISSTVNISGKEARVYKDGNNVVVKTASLFRIEDLVLKDGTILSIDQPAEDVRNYSSLNANGDPTVMSSPLNRIIFTSGSSFYIREETSPTTTDYGTVTGFTIMSVADQATFGAYVLGEPSSGGFVIMKNGLYETANISDFRDAAGHDIRCWFISGMEKKVITMELDYTGSQTTVSSGIDLTKLQAGSDIRFSGGDYVSSGMVIDFAASGFDEDTFGLKIGAIADNGSALIMNNENHYLFYNKSDASPHHMITGTVSNNGENFSAIGFPAATSDQITEAKKIYYKNGEDDYTQASEAQVIAGINLYYKNGEDDYTPATTAQIDARSKICYSSDDKYFSMATTDQLNTGSNLYFKSDSIPGTFRLNLQFMGDPANETDYLGYILLNVYEIQTFMVDGTPFELIVNQIEIRVDMYTHGDQNESNVTHDITIDTVGHEGYTDILVPSTHTGQTLKVTSVTAIASGEGKKIDIQGLGNISGTNGWKDVSSKSSLINFSQPITVGTLSGGYVATMRISVEGANVPSQFTVVCTIYDSNGVVKDTITINITVIDHENVEVTYIDEETTTTVQKTYGSTLLPTDCPSVSPNFIGWYVDAQYTKAYNFSLPLIDDITLYARYNYVVTFDYMDGSESTMNVPQKQEGVKIPSPSTPTRTGYTFTGWYKDTGYTDDWDFNTDKVTGDITLYAKWTAVQLTIEYYDGMTLKGSQTVYFGDPFGNNAVLDYGIDHFDHWTCSSKWIYSDTLIDSNIVIDWTNSKIRLDAQKYQDNSKTLYIMMDNSIGKLYYSTDGVNYTVATPPQIAARENLYYKENSGSSYTAATPEQISAAMSKVYSLLFTEATNDQITAGVDLYYFDGEHYTAATSEQITAGENLFYFDGSLEFTYILTSASRTGYNLDWWKLIGDDGNVKPDFKYKAGAQITISMDVDISGVNIIVKKVYLNSTLAFEYDDDTHILDSPYYLTFKADWVLIDYSVVLSNTSNTEGDGQPGVAQFTKHYYGEDEQGTIELKYTGTSIFSRWNVVGDYDPEGFDPTSEEVTLKIRGDCVISAVELSGQQVRIYVNFDYGDGTNGRIDTDLRPGSIYISYDETTLQELRIVPGAHTQYYELYKGQIKSLETEFEIYINRGTALNPDFCFLDRIDYANVNSLTLEEIIIVISTTTWTRTLDGNTVTCTDLTNTIESTSEHYYECDYGDGSIGTLYFITGGKEDVEYHGDSIAINGNDVTTVEEYAGRTYFTVSSTTQNVGETAYLYRTFYINVKPMHVFLVGVTEWTQQGENWGSGDTFVIYNDDGHAEDRMSVSSTARPSVQTPGVTVNAISYTFDSRYSVTVINGMYIVVKSDASTVCVDVIYDADPLHASMSAPLSVDQISEKAKLESAANIMAVINHSMGRRL